MTIEQTNPDVLGTPFIFKFSEPLSSSQSLPMKFDEVRQVAQVFIDDKWIDATDTKIESARSTRLTKVVAETTDDE